MATNDYLPFGTGAGANVLTQADYLALAARLGGFQAGVAKSVELNKVWRQASVIAAMIAQFTSDKTGQNVLDDGDLAALQAKFEAAIKTFTPGRLLAVRIFSSPGAVTYTPTPGTGFVRVRMQAGGGAGGGAVVTNGSQVSVGVGGSGGSYGEAVITSGFAGVTITTGAGGTPVSGGNGGAGGSSSFGSLLTVPGGVGGVFGPAATPSPLAGQNPPTTAPTGASAAIRGEGGYGGVASSATVAQGGRGGQSAFGVGGQLSSPAFAGNPALNRGAGGGSAANVNSAAATFPGGAGGDGITIIEEYSL